MPYVCDGFWAMEDCPSPKVHAKAGVPLHVPLFAVAAKSTGVPTIPVEGTVALQARPHPMTMEPVFAQENCWPPSQTKNVIVQS